MSHDIEGDFAEFFTESAAAADASLTADIHAQIEASSLGTPEARALRESVPVEVGVEIVRRAALIPERDAMTEVLLNHSWHPSEPRTAHAEHRYDWMCAICRCDLKAVALLILENGWRRAASKTSPQADLCVPAAEGSPPGPHRDGDACGPGGVSNNVP